jgi:hypothetical protein
LPDYELSNLCITFVEESSSYKIDFAIVQDGPVYQMPVEISAGGKITTFSVQNAVEGVSLTVESLPEKLILDPDYKISKSVGEVYLDLSVYS